MDRHRTRGSSAAAVVHVCLPTCYAAVLNPTRMTNTYKLVKLHDSKRSHSYMYQHFAHPRREWTSFEQMESIIVFRTMRGLLTHETPSLPFHLRDHQPTDALSLAAHPRKNHPQNINRPVANHRVVPRGITIDHRTLLESPSETVRC